MLTKTADLCIFKFVYLIIIFFPSSLGNLIICRERDLNHLCYDEQNKYRNNTTLDFFFFCLYIRI